MELFYFRQLEMRIPEVNHYFKKNVIYYIKKLVGYNQQNDKENFKKLTDQLIDKKDMLFDDGFLTLFGELATELYFQDKSEYLHQLNYYQSRTNLNVTTNEIDFERLSLLNYYQSRTSLNVFANEIDSEHLHQLNNYQSRTNLNVTTNEIDKEVVANTLDKKFSDLYSNIQDILEAKGFDDDFKEELHDQAIDMVYFYYELGIRLEPGKYMTKKDIVVTAKNALEIIEKFKDVLLSAKYSPNKKYQKEMFDHYHNLRKKGNKEHKAGYDTLVHFFGSDAISNEKVSIDGFCRRARDRQKLED